MSGVDLTEGACLGLLKAREGSREMRRADALENMEKKGISRDAMDSLRAPRRVAAVRQQPHRSLVPRLTGCEALGQLTAHLQRASGSGSRFSRRRGPAASGPGRVPGAAVGTGHCDASRSFTQDCGSGALRAQAAAPGARAAEERASNASKTAALGARRPAARSATSAASSSRTPATAVRQLQLHNPVHGALCCYSCRDQPGVHGHHCRLIPTSSGGYWALRG